MSRAGLSLDHSVGCPGIRSSLMTEYTGKRLLTAPESTFIGETLFQTGPEQEGGKIGSASLLHREQPLVVRLRGHYK